MTTVRGNNRKWFNLWLRPTLKPHSSLTWICFLSNRNLRGRRRWQRGVRFGRRRLWGERVGPAGEVCSERAACQLGPFEPPARWQTTQQAKHYRWITGLFSTNTLLLHNSHVSQAAFKTTFFFLWLSRFICLSICPWLLHWFLVKYSFTSNCHIAENVMNPSWIMY